MELPLRGPCSQPETRGWGSLAPTHNHPLRRVVCREVRRGILGVTVVRRWDRLGSSGDLPTLWPSLASGSSGPRQRDPEDGLKISTELLAATPPTIISPANENY